MSDLLVIVPTRGRPQNAVEFFDAFDKTTESSDTDLIFAVDHDDPTLDLYKEELSDSLVVRCPSGTMVEALNFIVKYGPDSKCIAFMGDDHRPRTQGWDVRYREVLDKLGTGIVYSDDGFQGKNLPTQVAMTADIPEALGYMAPPCLTHLYVDNFWKLLGEGADCLQYIPDVLIEHCHPLAKKAEWDSGYARVNSSEMYTRDANAFGHYVKDQLESDIQKIKALR